MINISSWILDINALSKPCGWFITYDVLHKYHIRPMEHITLYTAWANVLRGALIELQLQLRALAVIKALSPFEYQVMLTWAKNNHVLSTNNTDIF